MPNVRPMDRPLALAIVGCGAVVELAYRSALARLEKRGIARVAALVDPNPERTAALKRHFQSARTFAALGDAFAHMRPDLTVVTSPPAGHVEHTLAAIDAGSHVLCEKPMAIASQEAERMVAAAQVGTRVLAIGMARRLYPGLADARALLAAGALGDEVRFIYREGAVYNWPVSTEAPFRRATSGGGVLTDLGSHVLDVLSALFGTPSVAAYQDDAHADGVEANCWVDLGFPRASGTVQLSWNQPLATGLRVAGTKGELTLRPGPLEAVRWRRHGGSWEIGRNAATWPLDLQAHGPRGAPRSTFDCMYFQLVQTLRAAVHGEVVPATGEQGLAIVRAIETCYRQATPLRLPWLTATEQTASDARHWSGQWAAA
jgi:predicted dehydrogenase